MALLKDVKFVILFVVMIASGGVAVGSRTTAVPRKDFAALEEKTQTLETKAAAHEQHDRDVDNAIEDLRRTNQKILETVIGIAQRQK